MLSLMSDEAICENKIFRAIAAAELRVFPIAEKPSSTFEARAIVEGCKNQFGELFMPRGSMNTDDTLMTRR